MLKQSVRGYLVIADISGYTQLLAETELLHARFIVARVLQSLLIANTLPLEVSKIEGDAILFYTNGCAAVPEQIVTQLNALCYAFRETKAELGRTLDCSCQCCSQLDKLALKFVIHTGEFAEEPIGQFSELIGWDVVVLHRLLKNTIPHKSYMLFTEEFLRQAQPSLRSLVLPITLVYEDIGTINGGYCVLERPETPEGSVSKESKAHSESPREVLRRLISRFA